MNNRETYLSTLEGQHTNQCSHELTRKIFVLIRAQNSRLSLFALFFFFCCSSGYAGVMPSEWDSYCRKCHIDRPVNSLYDPSSKAHVVKSIQCVTCHPNKGISGHVKRSEEGFRSLFQNVTLPPEVRPQRSASMTSDDCLRCHPYIREVDEVSEKKLPKEVRPISLRAAHEQHWDFRTFTQEQQDKLNALMKRKAEAGSFNKTEQDQLDHLLRARNMQCSRCHERFKKDSPGGIDSNVNIAMRNPMECVSCHVALRTAIHPGDASSLPSAVSCARCHQGKLHQKLIFFPVDRGKKSDCLSCHPSYTPDKVIGVMPEQFSHKSTGTQLRTKTSSGKRERD